MKNVSWSTLLVISASFMVASSAHAAPRGGSLETPIVDTSSPIVSGVSQASSGTLQSAAGSSGSLQETISSGGLQQAPANGINADQLTPVSQQGSSGGGTTILTGTAIAQPVRTIEACLGCSPAQQANWEASRAAAIQGGAPNNRYKANAAN